MTSAGTPATLRLFVAADLPDEARRKVSAWQQRYLGSRDEVRVNHALHVTLAFLGSMPAASVSGIADALAGVPVREAPVEVGQPAFLPIHGAKRVVVLPLEDQSGVLTRLQADVSGVLAARGLYEPPGRPWLPHVTVARFRRPGHPFPLQNVNIGGFGVVRMVLYSSLLERAGAVHTPLNVFSAS